MTMCTLAYTYNQYGFIEEYIYIFDTDTLKMINVHVWNE